MRGASLVVLGLWVPLLFAQSNKQRPEEGKLKVGDAVPAVTMEDLAGKNRVKLAELKSKPVVLIFGSCT